LIIVEKMNNCTADLVFYFTSADGPRYVDTRTLSSDLLHFLEEAVENQLRKGLFTEITFSVSLPINKQYGTLLFDSEANNDFDRFLDFWVFPSIKKLNNDWSVIISMTKRTVYDNAGNKVDALSWGN